jgi:hypothetical protein
LKSPRHPLAGLPDFAISLLLFPLVIYGPPKGGAVPDFVAAFQAGAIGVHSCRIEHDRLSSRRAAKATATCA